MNIRTLSSLAAAIALSVLCSPAISAQDADSVAFSSIDWQWQDLGKGAQAGYAQVRLFDSVQSISVVRYPARRFHTSFVHAPGESASSTDTLAMRADARFAMNGSFFNMRTLEPATFFSQKHQAISGTDEWEMSRSDGLLAIPKKNGRKMEILYYDPSALDTYTKDYYTTLASGPVIMKDGEVGNFDPEGSFAKTRHPRSFIGLTDDGRTVYIIVVDGRFHGEAAGASISELYLIAKWFGMEDAINFDGGGSSALWTDRTGIINHPCDNSRFDHAGARKVPNILIVK